MFNHESPSLIFRKTNGSETDESGSDYNSDFGEDQDGEDQFSTSDMDDEKKNFPKQKVNLVSNEGKMKPLLLKGNQQHRTKKPKASNIREAEMEVMTETCLNFFFYYLLNDQNTQETFVCTFERGKNSVQYFTYYA